MVACGQESASDIYLEHRPYVEIQRRDDGWQPTAATSLEEIGEFRSIGLSLPLPQMYEDVPVSAVGD